MNDVWRPNVTVAAIPVAEGVEVRAGLTRWAGCERAHLRTWYRGRDGRWRPTRAKSAIGWARRA